MQRYPLVLKILLFFETYSVIKSIRNLFKLVLVSDWFCQVFNYCVENKRCFSLQRLNVNFILLSIMNTVIDDRLIFYSVKMKY